MQRLFQKRYTYTFISPRVRSDPLPLLGSDVTENRGEDTKTLGECVSCIRTYPPPRILAIILRPCVRSPCKSILPRAPTHGGDSVKGRLVFVTIAPSTVFSTGGVEVTSLASMARVTSLMSSLTVMFEQNLVMLLVTGSTKPSGGIPFLHNPPSNRFPLNGDSMGSARGRIEREG